MNNLQTFNDPNRNKTKKFQWHKLHLFDEYMKNWDYIFYLDINMNIHYDINKILDISQQIVLWQELTHIQIMIGS